MPHITMKTILLSSIALLLGACASGSVSTERAKHLEAGSLKRVGVLMVNYTDFEVSAVLIDTGAKERVGLAGPVRARESGGVGPARCCYELPKPGAPITIYWKSPTMGEHQHIKRTAVLTGQAPADPNQFSHLILRFMNDFPAATIQAEYISDEELKAGRASKRIDPLLWPVLDQPASPSERGMKQ